ncbi:hypothetical protein EON62_04765 [archaeon]|nr:MAG: hypothetical protein EON62_04765 [archaeon]
MHTPLRCSSCVRRMCPWRRLRSRAACATLRGTPLAPASPLCTRCNSQTARRSTPSLCTGASEACFECAFNPGYATPCSRGPCHTALLSPPPPPVSCSAAERTITQKLVMDKSPASEVVWNPRGEFFVLADRTKSSAVFSVYDVERKETLAELAHPGANDMSWDPSGRVFVTMKTCHAASSASEMSDNGYMLWTFQGVLLAHIKKPVLHVLRWRPRPTGLLTDEEIRDATKNYKKYQRKFEEMDKRDDERRMLLARLEKRRQLDEFRSLVSARHSAWVEDAAERAHLNIETPRYVEEEFEYLVSESVTADVQQGGGAASAL